MKVAVKNGVAVEFESRNPFLKIEIFGIQTIQSTEVSFQRSLVILPFFYFKISPFFLTTLTKMSVFAGKEANVYHGTDYTTSLAVKIYKTSILTFKDRERYVAGEYRFASVPYFFSLVIYSYWFWNVPV